MSIYVSNLSVGADLEVWSRCVVNQRSGDLSGDVLGDQLHPKKTSDATLKLLLGMHSSIIYFSSQYFR